MGSIWRDYKITIKRSRGLLEEPMKKDEKGWKKEIFMKREQQLLEESMRSKGRDNKIK